MEKKYIIGIDEGTTSARTVIYDTTINQIVYKKRIKFEQIYPQDGWVEHDAEKIYECVMQSLEDGIKELNLKCEQIYSIGITNQRETVVAWDRRTGKPVYNAIVWQCRRTSDYCKTVPYAVRKQIQKRTGLILDAYFSATKMRWILKNVSKARQLLKTNNLCFGTIDSYLLFRLTNGKSFYTDSSNASRTMLYNINTLMWDEYLLNYFKIPLECLPQVLNSADNFGSAQTSIGEIPIVCVLGDQQASLFGQGCTNAGDAKSTFGTGCFILLNTGSEAMVNNKKMLSTIAWTINNKATYALEGSVFNAGGALEWLTYDLKLVENSRQTSDIAFSVSNTEGTYMVPAFTGLGAPYWDSYARGTIVGITRKTKKEHLVRAVLEGIAYNTYDILQEMESKGIKITQLKCDGGVSNNQFLMQFQSSIANINILTSENSEATVLGCIYMAGLYSGVYKNAKQINKLINFEKTYKPDMNDSTRKILLKGWKRAVGKSLKWAGGK